MMEAYVTTKGEGKWSRVATSTFLYNPVIYFHILY